MSVESKTNYSVDNKLHILYFILGTVFLIGSLMVPDIVSLTYWYKEAIGVGFAILSTILYAYSVQTYLKKDVEITVNESLELQDNVSVEVNSMGDDN